MRELPIDPMPRRDLKGPPDGIPVPNRYRTFNAAPEWTPDLLACERCLAEFVSGLEEGSARWLYAERCRLWLREYRGKMGASRVETPHGSFEVTSEAEAVKARLILSLTIEAGQDALSKCIAMTLKPGPSKTADYNPPLCDDVGPGL